MRVIHFPSFPFCLVYFWIRQTRNKRKNKTIVHFSVVAFLLFCFSYRLFFCVLRRPALPTLYFCTYTSIEQWCYMHLTLAVWLAFIARCSQSKCIFFFSLPLFWAECIIASSESSSNNKFFERICARLIGFRFQFFCILRVPIRAGKYFFTYEHKDYFVLLQINLTVIEASGRW